MATPPFLIKSSDRTKAKNVESAIMRVLGDIPGTGAYKREGQTLDKEDAKNLIVGVILKFDNDALREYINEQRVERGLPEIKIDKRDLYDWKRAYADAIDQSYIAVATYIGELYPFADKIHRIGLVNDIIEALKPVVPMLAYSDEEITIKKVNLLLKAVGALNAELGNKTLFELFAPKGKKFDVEDEDGKPKQISKEEAEKMLTEHFSAQLPAAVSQKIVFSDYRNCANGEILGDNVICWNDHMCGGKGGSPCAVQEGRKDENGNLIAKCPKFLNKSLLSDKEWLLRMRHKLGLNYKELSVALGCDTVDEDIRNRIDYYFKLNGLTARVGFSTGNPNWGKKEENNPESVEQTDL